MRDWIAPLFTWVIGPFFAYLFLRWRLKVENAAYAQRKEIDRQEPPTETLKGIIENQAREIHGLRDQMHTIWTNHLEHDRQEREQAARERAENLQAMTTLQNQLSTTLDSMKALHDQIQQEAAARQALSEKVSSVSERVARLEGAAG
jgi:chromosome segregation ATPase